VSSRTTRFKYVGISIPESEIIYSLLSNVFGTVEEENVPLDDSGIPTIIEIHFPLPYGDDFFILFKPEKWTKLKGVITEIKKRRGKSQVKVSFIFPGVSGEHAINTDLVFEISESDSKNFEAAIERVEVLVEVIVIQISTMPSNALQMNYCYEPTLSRWRPGSVKTHEGNYYYVKNRWERKT
jgi:hypothetical protein